jgi:PAS domain S-box-containing protein
MKKAVDNSALLPIRQKAEEIWESGNKVLNNSLSEYESLKLIHELQVHQIELELQNDELQLVRENAENAKAKYIELFDFAPLGYFILTRNAVIREANFRGAEMFGKERSKIFDSNFQANILEQSKPLFGEFLDRVFSNHITESVDIVIPPRNGSPLFLHVTGIAKKGEDYCLISAVDITGHKMMEKELIRAKEQAEENDQLKTAFLHNMSHEIRTPMNAIKGFSDLLVSRNYDALTVAKFSKIISQSSSDLLNIINDILDIARIESGQLQIHLEECLLSSLFGDLSETFTEYQLRYNKQHIKLKLILPEAYSKLVIITDTGKVKQVLINLLTNAFKFTEQGFIEVSCIIAHDHARFLVTDTGIGIPIEMQKAVFERFIQLKQQPSHVSKGTGLGLTIIKGLVSLLGGQIQLQSEPGKGSTFSFDIPCMISKSKVLQQEEPEKPAALQFSNRKVLVVEDESFNARFLEEVLSTAGLEVILAVNGNQAVQIALSQPVDLVLLDIKLPDMSGYEVLRQIKLIKPDMKFIAQTAFASFEDKQKSTQAGCIDFISKPINHSELLTMLKAHL